MSYLKAVLKKDHDTKIKELENLVLLGEKLNKDTTPDRKKLEILLKRHNKTSKLQSQTKKIEKKDELKNKKNIKPLVKLSNDKNTIQSVYTYENSIVINYANKVNDSYVRFFELRQKPYIKDVYDLKGNYKLAYTTKLKLQGVQKIVIAQFKPDTIRIVATDKKNIKTSFKTKDNQVIITFDELKSNKNEQFIDTKNSIRSIYTQDNKIVVNFNKNISKNYLKYTGFKNKSYFNDIFDIKGTYAYAKPLKLNIDGLDKISVGQKEKNKLRIRISNKKDIKVYYKIYKKQIVIRVVGLPKTKEVKQEIIVPKIKKSNKVIVIDAGHGGHDVGAVGPNKRYEKVVTLKIAKYLYSILKQRGHKVYLTRTTDKFIKVGNRTDLARKKNADVFISIHANSVPKSKASKVHGIETFYLSPAKSERAKRVAAKENKTDSRRMSKATIDAAFGAQNYLVMKSSHALSIAVQTNMLESLRKKYDVKDKGAKTGPFWVLLDTPKASILVEVGFISHPIESKRLYSSDYQKKLALGMANGIEFYFQHPVN